MKEIKIRNLRKLRERAIAAVKAGIPGLAEIIDLPAIQSLMDDFYVLARIPWPSSISRAKYWLAWVAGRLYEFPPGESQTCNTASKATHSSPRNRSGEFRLYKCKNNMWDISTPIMVDGRHVGNLFSGQFFFDDESLDYALFRAQAKKYGFDEEAYITALECVPRLSRDALNTGMAFFMKLATLISKLGHGNLELARTLAERKRRKKP